MKSTQFEQFIKLMQLASSDNDAEALAALRRAQRTLADAGFTWEMILRRQVTVLSEVEPGEEIGLPDAPSAANRDYELDESDFELAMDGTSGSFYDTLFSIYEQWERGDRLSPKQRQVVRDAAERAASRHPGGRVRR